MTQLYPLFIDIRNRLIVVIGGGQVSERKVLALLEREALVQVISPELTAGLESLAKKGEIQAVRRCYQPGDLAGAWLVIASSDDQDVNRQVFTEANEQHVFCNVVDVPELCSFHVPSVVHQGELQIASSTGGASPAMAKRIRKELQQKFGPHYATFLEVMKELREHVKAKYPEDQSVRGKILEEFVNSDALELLQEGKIQEFEQLLEESKAK
ncbi:MAG: bifunctional precorrin-2 dehydrogenase/sirohydrochlorin ferrochelatase [Phycisphaerae bacterium]|nr:bifunctional precorrin-2 dehydrogenase/sirohydrochlorin ferrochelatase [Phycisphaerae bacterium]